MNGFQTTQVSAPSFESIRFANKTAVTINGNGGIDTLAFNNPTPATGLTTLNVVSVGAVTQTGAVNYSNLSSNHRAGDTDRQQRRDQPRGFGLRGGQCFSFNDVDESQYLNSRRERRLDQQW